MSTLLDVTPRVAELGRIRLGEKGPKGEPVRLKTFRLTSGSEKLLEAAAILYGGKVRAWSGAPDEGFYELTTTVSELDILVPRQDSELGVISQAYELWQGGTCERRCDGKFESIGRTACLCDPDERECEVITRVSVMLPRVPGLGVWRLDTGGWQAATTLPATLGLLSQLSPGRWIPAVLRAEQRSKKVRQPDGKVQTHRFVVPVLDLPGTTIGQLTAGEIGEAPMLAPGEIERPAPPTAAERAAQRAAQVRAQSGWVRGATGPEHPGMQAALDALVTEGVLEVVQTDEPVPQAPAGEVVAAASPADSRCVGFDVDRGRCVLDEGHTTNHKNKEGETWR